MPYITKKIRQVLSIASLSITVSGCASYGMIHNQKIDKVAQGTSVYSVDAFNHRLSGKKTSVFLAFSGGGTRAAALAYGVLAELNETFKDPATKQAPLSDDIALISAVSGGSFTAAYYGLHGEGMFNDFEERFLKKDVEQSLIKNVINPINWFGRKSRTEHAIEYYDKEVFDGATFKDMLKPDRPMVLINTTDLSKGVRFSFMQEYFNLLCSDLNDFSVSRAVTASSAVPILFTPVVVKNYSECFEKIPGWLKSARRRAKSDPELRLQVKGLESYFDKENHQYAHFVDGGITDNLGLRAFFDISKLLGGAKATNRVFNIDAPERLIIISVDASASPNYDIANSANPPGLLKTINAMTDIQLHRYNTATLSDMQAATKSWVSELSNDGKNVSAHFVRLSFDGVQSDQKMQELNRIPTTFSLTSEQVDLLIETGRNLLRNNPEFIKAIQNIQN